MEKTIIILILTFFYGCMPSDRKPEIFMSDKDFVEFSRQYSPDSSMILLNYGIDQGALGFGQGGSAVLKLSDTTKNILKFTLSKRFDRCNWVNNKTVIAKYNIIPSIRNGKQTAISDTTINGIYIKVSSYDYIKPNSKRIIVHRETSPNGKYELVAYRYVNNKHNLNFIHLSVIPKNGQIPKYGNYLIADMQSDYVLNGKWDKNNTLIFYSNNLYGNLIQYYLVKNRPDIKYRVIINDKKFGSKYRWTKQSSR